MAFSHRCFTPLCFVMLIILGEVYSGYVPLLLWTNSRSLKCDSSDVTRLTVRTVDSVFTDDYLKCLKSASPQNILLFLPDQLSIEDFRMIKKSSGSADEYLQNIKTYTKSPSSLIVPALEAAGVLTNLRSKLSTHFPAASLQVVSLHGDLAASDGEIKQKLDSMNGNYIAILTSQHSAEPVFVIEDSDDMPHHSIMRRAAGDEAGKGNATLVQTCAIGECILLCFSSLKLVAGGTPVKLTLASDVQNTTQICHLNGTSSTLTMELTPTPDTIISKVTLTMIFAKKFFPVSAMKWWEIGNVEVDYTKNSNSSTSQLTRRSFKQHTAPETWSFACSRPRNFTDVKKTVLLEFQDLQLQPFDVVSGNFSRVVDCEAWFTAPILTGLFTVFFIIVMLSYAFMMITNITTMDRFDDPKGKCLVVPQD